MARRAGDIAVLIDSLQATYAATSTMLAVTNDDDFLNFFETKGFGHGSTIHLRRKDDTCYKGIDVWKSVHAVQKNPQFNLDYLRAHLGTMISWIGHNLKENKYFDEHPLLEFFKHIRNGISHGNTFTFLGKEPAKPARFRGFEITKSLNGQCVLFDYIEAGDVMDLLDEVKVHLRTLP